MRLCTGTLCNAHTLGFQCVRLAQEKAMQLRIEQQGLLCVSADTPRSTTIREMAREWKRAGALAKNMLTMDDPDYTRLRGIVDEAFHRYAVRGMGTRIRALADDLAGELFANGSPADVVERYARMLPTKLLAALG